MTESLVFAARVLLAGIFLIALTGKLRDREEFAQWLRSLRLPVPVRPAVPAVLAAEMACVVLLLLPGGWGFALATGLLGLFTVVIAAKLVARDPAPPCHCFGAGSMPMGGFHLVRNLLLMAVAVGALVQGDQGIPDSAAVLLPLGILAAVAVAKAEKPTVAKAEKSAAQKGGKRRPRFAAETLEGGLLTDADLRRARPPVLVAFFAMGCPRCKELLPAFMNVAESMGAERVFALVAGSNEDPLPLARELSAVATVMLEPARGPVATAFGVEFFPAFCVLGADGQIHSTNHELPEALQLQP